MKPKLPILILLLLVFAFYSYPQDKGIFVEKKKGFYEDIKKSADEFSKIQKPEKKSFKVDFSEKDLPKSIEEFNASWFNEPISQGITGTCWSFSTTSFFESEVYRLHGKKIKLSEIFNVYWEYIEKAKRYVLERGDSEFSEGSEANAVTRIWNVYGAAPAEVYSGMKAGQEIHDHSKLVNEMKKYLQSIKAGNAWDQDEVVKTIRAIMNHYIGEPPAEFNVDGKKYTPTEYLRNYLKLTPDDYVNILSIKQQPYWQQASYEVPDNWWLSKDYYNVPLDDYMNGIKTAVRKGYTICISGDVSESGLDGWYNAAVVPDFDIPSEYINEDARQFRFSNETTTDDHLIHLIGYKEKDGKDWYLIKDSGSGSRNGDSKGFMFFHEDYVKLKMLAFMVHKDAVKDLLSKFDLSEK